LIRLVGPAVNKINKNFQNAIRLTERLPITLRFLANGDSHCRTTYLFTLSEQSVRLTSQLFETQMNTDARLLLFVKFVTRQIFADWRREPARVANTANF
jgi:hypothetical protein